MVKISLELPDTLAEKDARKLTELAREALVVRLYALSELTSGEGAELLGVTRRSFLDLLGTYNVSLFDETANLRKEASYE
jgi:predicted HTH domain antitoxin